MSEKTGWRVTGGLCCAALVLVMLGGVLQGLGI